MKTRFGIIVLLVLTLFFFAAGCLDEGEEVEVESPPVDEETALEDDPEPVDLGEDVGAEDIYARSMAALAEANACNYIMEIDIDINLPDLYDQSSNIITEGKTTMDPPADEMMISFDSPEMQMDFQMYIVDELVYIEVPEVGWLWLDEDDDFDMASFQEDFTDTFAIAERIGLERAQVEFEDNHYLVFFDSDDEVFNQVIKDLALEQTTGDSDTEDLFDTIKFQEVYFGFIIDRSTFLPSSLTLNYSLAMEIEGETLTT